VRITFRFNCTTVQSFAVCNMEQHLRLLWPSLFALRNWPTSAKRRSRVIQLDDAAASILRYLTATARAFAACGALRSFPNHHIGGLFLRLGVAQQKEPPAFASGSGDSQMTARRYCHDPTFEILAKKLARIEPASQPRQSVFDTKGRAAQKFTRNGLQLGNIPFPLPGMRSQWNKRCRGYWL